MLESIPRKPVFQPRQGRTIRVTQARIHLQNLRHNVAALRERTTAALCPAVKADAYGHGAVRVARELAELGVEMLCIASVDEGRELRQAGITLPLLLLSQAAPDETDDLARLQLEPLASDQDYLQVLEASAIRTGQTVKVHLKVNVGMGRLGCPPGQVLPLARSIVHSPHLEFTGFCTHFPSSDNGQAEPTRSQLGVFNSCLDELQQAGFRPRWIHTANSSAILDFPEAHFNLVRPGILLYGYAPSPETEASARRGLGFKPVMELVSALSFLKLTTEPTPLSYGSTWTAPAGHWIATVPAGYADGVSRQLSSRGQVRLGQRLLPITGRVCMDQFMVDCGPETPPALWTEVSLFGPLGPTAADVAALMGTIPYEVTCLITKRVPRVYLD